MMHKVTSSESLDVILHLHHHGVFCNLRKSIFNIFTLSNHEKTRDQLLSLTFSTGAAHIWSYEMNDNTGQS